MKLLVACIDKDYDCDKILKLYPDYAIYISTKSESKEIVKCQIKLVELVVYDSENLSDFNSDCINYAIKHKKKVINLSEVK